MPLVDIKQKANLYAYKTDYSYNYLLYLKTIYFRYVTPIKNYEVLPEYTDNKGKDVLKQYDDAVKYYNTNNDFTNNNTTGEVTFSLTTGLKSNFYVVPYDDESLEKVNKSVQTLSATCNDFDINNKTYSKDYKYDTTAVNLFNTDIIKQTQTVCDYTKFFLKNDINIAANSFTINLNLTPSVLTLDNGNNYVNNLKNLHILEKTIYSIKTSANFTDVNTSDSVLQKDYMSDSLWGSTRITSGVQVKTLFDNLGNALVKVSSVLEGVLQYVVDAAVDNANTKLQTANTLNSTSTGKNATAFESKNKAIDPTSGKVKLSNDAKITAGNAVTYASNAKSTADGAKTADAYLASKNAAEEALKAAQEAKNAADTANSYVIQAHTDAGNAQSAAYGAKSAADVAKSAADEAKLLNDLLRTSITNKNTIYDTTTYTVPDVFDINPAGNALSRATINLNNANAYTSELSGYIAPSGINSASLNATNAATEVNLAINKVNAANQLAGQNIVNKYNGSGHDANTYKARPDDSIKTNVDYINNKTRELYQMSGSKVDVFKSQYIQTMILGAIMTIIMSALLYFVFSNIYNEGLGSSGNGSSNMPVSNGLPRT
jgi:hypothetical protein